MSTIIKLLVVLALILLTNLATFLFLNWRFRQELQGEGRLRVTQSERVAELEAELATAQQELDRLAVWTHFIQLQQELTAVENDIERLNFGDALRRVEGIAGGIEAGQYGGALQEQRASLLPPLEAAQQALARAQGPPARRSLAELNERAFVAVSGIAHPAELRVPLTEPTPIPEPQTPPPPATEEVEEPEPAEVEPPDLSRLPQAALQVPA